MFLDLNFKPIRSKNVHILKCLWATHLYLTFSTADADIAKAINVSVRKLQFLKRTPYWDQAMRFWNPDYQPSEDKSKPTPQPPSPEGQQTLRRFDKSAIKTELYESQNGVCNGCRIKFPFRNMTIDHIQPQSRGGSDSPDNLQLLCYTCNSTKGVKTHAELLELLQAQGVIGSEAHHDEIQ